MVIGSLGELPVQMLCPPGLISLIEHDKVSSTSYLETLRCFLENNTNVTRTAAELFVHRSTLLERLTRIRRELDVDLDDPDMQLRLRMILKVMQISERQAG
jgi:DNA-binding PucR family transcriptional regulator